MKYVYQKLVSVKKSTINTLRTGLRYIRTSISV